MKKQLFLLFASIFLISCSQNIIRNPMNGEKSDFGITSPSKALFFVENEKIDDDEEKIKTHTKTANEIYSMFGEITDKMMVGRTNAKTFKFTRGKKTWLVDVNKMPKRTAMILFDGLQKPFIEYDSEKYLPLTKQYFAEDLKEKNILKQTIKADTKTTKTIVDSLWTISFVPDKQYASAITYNLKRYYSPAIFGFNSNNCDGTIFTETFTDLKQTKLSYASSVTYANGKITSDEYVRNGEVSGQKRHFSSLGLLDSMVYYSNKEADGKIEFKYLPDRIISRYNKSLSRDEYLLNDKFQISKKISFDARNQTESEQNFFYDNFGRMVKEEYYSSGKKLSTNIFEYEGKEQKRFSKMKVIPSDESYISENTSSIIDGRETFINTMNGKIQSKTISYMNNQCEGKVLMYDGYNAITGVTIQRKIKK
ncbi:hypothetical protein [Epilithonimonas zeae]|uniref:hypothetical protein n=1 Tax=Epilithonimonas zeae TaxID=1416779 RepID=UPI00200E9D7E|nr:hypothetical protein [Epilithonimonas zeae]UQB70138.1 hypothetical protein KI430_06845 [Epilithonimonas zeae]